MKIFIEKLNSFFHLTCQPPNFNPSIRFLFSQIKFIYPFVPPLISSKSKMCDWVFYLMAYNFSNRKICDTCNQNHYWDTLSINSIYVHEFFFFPVWLILLRVSSITNFWSKNKQHVFYGLGYAVGNYFVFYCEGIFFRCGNSISYREKYFTYSMKWRNSSLI